MIKSKPIPVFDHEKFLSKVIAKEKDCWRWSGFINNYGYGEMIINGKSYRTHRISFSIFNGELIDGMVIDHICKNKSCINPDHLRQVTQKFNCLDNSSSPLAENSRKTHCKNGHELTEDNIYKKKNWRCCLACKKIDHIRHNQKLKEKRRIAKLAKQALGE